MASGLGVRGTVGRCYPFFSDYKTCLSDYASAKGQVKIEESSEEGGKPKIVITPREKPNCYLFKEDYLECLHGIKAKARAAIIEHHAALKAAEEAGGGHGHH